MSRARPLTGLYPTRLQSSRGRKKSRCSAGNESLLASYITDSFQIFYKNVNYIATYDRSVTQSHIPHSFWSLIKASFLAQLKKQGLTALRDTLISLLVKKWLGYEIV